MFSFSSARCKGCYSVFCCATHRKSHQKSCKTFKEFALEVAANKATSEKPIPIFRIGTQLAVGFSQPRSLKRKHGQPMRYSSHVAGVEARLSLGQRKFKLAIRGKFRKVQKIPMLESIKEDDESSDQYSATEIKSNEDPVLPHRPQNSTSAMVEVRKSIPSAAKISDAYKEFITGTLRDSPIEVIKGSDEFAGSPREKCDSGGTPNPSGPFKSPVDALPPVATPSSSGFKTQMPPMNAVALPWLTPNIVGAFKTSTPKDLDGEPGGSDEDGQSGPQPTDESPRVTAVVSPLATPVESQSAKRTFEVMRDSSTPYYSARSWFSPCPPPGNMLLSGQGEEPSPLTSHEMTIIPGLSILESVRNVFHNLVRRMPGNTEKTPDGMDSPMRKRIRLLANSKIQCRPTYRGRYKKPPPYQE